MPVLPLTVYQDRLNFLLHEVAQPAPLNRHLRYPGASLVFKRAALYNRNVVVDSLLLRVGVLAPCAGLEVFLHFQVTATFNFHLMLIIALSA